MCDVNLTIIVVFYVKNDIIIMVILMSDINNVPQWILESTTGLGKQNDEVGLIVASFIGAFRKRGFDQKEIGIMMAQAFLLPLEEVERRVDSVLSCADGDGDVKKLCLYVVQKGCLFGNDNADPCEIIALLKEWYGEEAAFETLLTFPEILRLWKNKDVRDSEKYSKEKEMAEKILKECAEVFEMK